MAAVKPGGNATTAVERDYGPLTVTEIIPVDRTESAKVSPGEVAGVVMGFLAMALVVAGGVFWRLRRTNSMRVAALREGPPPDSLIAVGVGASGVGVGGGMGLDTVGGAMTYAHRKKLKEQAAAMTRHQLFVEKLLAQEYNAVEEAALDYDKPGDALVVDDDGGVRASRGSPPGGGGGIDTNVLDGNGEKRRPRRTRQRRLTAHYDTSFKLFPDEPPPPA